VDKKAHKQIVIDVHHDQMRVALLEDGNLMELYIEGKDRRQLVGNIYRGRVQNVLPGMQAAFVSIGLSKNAFLFLGDMNLGADASVFNFVGNGHGKNRTASTASVRELIQEGQEITVQILKEPIGSKGARVTTHLTLPGRYLVLLPTVNHVGVSRRIEDEEERNRLREIAERTKPEGMGLIVRTAARDRGEEEFAADIKVLTRLWRQIQRREQGGEVPRLLHQDIDILYRTIRDMMTLEIDEMVINNAAEHERALEYADAISPALVGQVRLYTGEQGIFEAYGIESKIQQAIQKKVWLNNGGYLVIDPTEALTVIDVNTGKYVGHDNLEETVLQTNLAAAEEIARQIRLRDIGGIIIIDFIDMASEENRQQVLTVFEEALKRDRTKTHVVGITGLGLVEMTRKKVRKRLSSTLLSPCPYCNGTGKVYSASMILARIEKELEQTFSEETLGALVEVHPSVFAIWVDDDGRAVDILEKTWDKRIYLAENPSFHVEEFNIIPIFHEADVDPLLFGYSNVYGTSGD
jgi:ribonuclease G